MDHIIVGLDIGTTKTVILAGKRNAYNKIQIIAHGKAESLGVRRGMVSNISNTVKSIQQALDAARQSSDTLIVEVNIGIAGKHIRSMQQRGQKIRKNANEPIEHQEIQALIEDMYSLSTVPGEEIFDVIPQEFIIDGEDGITEPVGMLGASLEGLFHIILGQTTAARNIITCVNKCQLKPQNLILESIASASSVLNEEEKEAGVVLVDIGGGTSDVAIFKDSIIRHTAVIPEGGDAITQDIQEGCSLVKSRAEQLKQQFGSAIENENDENANIAVPSIGNHPSKEISLRSLAGIIQASCESILLKVMIEIRNSGYETDQLIGGIVLTGGGAQLKHLVQLTAYMTGMPTRIGLPDEHVSENTIEALRNPSYATSIGLVIAGLDKMQQSLEMMDDTVDEEAPTAGSQDTTDEADATTDDSKQEEAAADTTKPAKAKTGGLSSFKNTVNNWFSNFLNENNEEED